MILMGWERQKTHVGAAPSGTLECRALAEVMAEAKLLPGPSRLLEPGSVAHQGTNGRSSG